MWEKILKMPKLSFSKMNEFKELMQDGEWRTIQDILDALDLDSSYRNRIKGKLGKLRQGGYPKYNKRKIEVERKNRVGNRTKTIYEYKISLNE